MNPPTRAPRKPAIYRPSWWVWLVIALVGVAVAWEMTAFPAFPWARHWQWLALGGSVFGVWIAGHLLWILGSRRRRTFDPVFLGLVGTVWMLFLIWGREVQVRHNQVLVDRVASARDQFVRTDSRLQRQGPGMRLVALGEDRFLRYKDVLAQKDLHALQTLDRALLDGLETAHHSVRKAIEPVSELNPDTWLQAATRSELVAMREAYSRLYERRRAFLDNWDTFKERYEDGINALDLDPGGQRLAIAELERILQRPELFLASRVSSMEIEVLELIMEALTILEAEWGQWRFSRSEGQLLFENKHAEEAFFYALMEIEAIYTQVRALLDEALR